MPPHVRLGRKEATPSPTTTRGNHPRGMASPPGFQADGVKKSQAVSSSTVSGSRTPTTNTEKSAPARKRVHRRTTSSGTAGITLMPSSSPTAQATTSPISLSPTNGEAGEESKRNAISEKQVSGQKFPTGTEKEACLPPPTPTSTSSTPTPPAAGEAEIIKAAEWIAQQLTPLIGAREAAAVQPRLTAALAVKFARHWHVAYPSRGSGYRCIRSVPGKMDPLTLACVSAEIGLAAAAACAAQLVFAVWTDPGEVSVRLGENGKVAVILSTPGAPTAIASGAGDTCDNNNAIFSGSSSSGSSGSDSEGGWDSPAMVRRRRSASPTDAHRRGSVEGGLSPSAHSFSPVRSHSTASAGSTTPPPQSSPHTHRQHQYNQQHLFTSSSGSPAATGYLHAQPEHRLTQPTQQQQQQQHPFAAHQQQYHASYTPLNFY